MCAGDAEIGPPLRQPPGHRLQIGDARTYIEAAALAAPLTPKGFLHFWIVLGDYSGLDWQTARGWRCDDREFAHLPGARRARGRDRPAPAARWAGRAISSSPEQRANVVL